MSVLCIAESLTRLPCVINTTFREKIYIRWCCIDRLSWHLLSECGFCPRLQPHRKISRSILNQFSWRKIVRPAMGYEPCQLLALARIKVTANVLRSFATDSAFPSAFSPSFLHHFR